MRLQKTWTTEDREFLTNSYGVLLTKDIAIKLDRTYQSVKSMATLLKLKYGSVCKNSLKPLMEDSNFVWYWLGFIAGDGCIENDYLKINLHKNDEEHLRVLALFLKTKISYTSKGYPMISVGDSCGMGDFKSKIGYNGSAKTYNPLNIDYNISEDMMLSFIVGLIDADGCIELAKTNKVKQIKIECHNSWLENLEKIGSFLKDRFDIKSVCTTTSRGYALFRITGHKNALFLREEILKLKIPYLNRKWDKIDLGTVGTNFFSNIQDEVVSRYKKGQNLCSIAKDLNINYNSLFNHKDKIIKSSQKI